MYERSLPEPPEIRIVFACMATDGGQAQYLEAENL
jgi:hypothetical protein